MFYFSWKSFEGSHFSEKKNIYRSCHSVNCVQTVMKVIFEKQHSLCNVSSFEPHSLSIFWSFSWQGTPETVRQLLYDMKCQNNKRILDISHVVKLIYCCDSFLPSVFNVEDSYVFSRIRLAVCACICLGYNFWTALAKNFKIYVRTFVHYLGPIF